MSFPQPKFFGSLVALVCVVLVAGCRSKERDFTPHVVRLYIEESARLPASHISEMILPISGSHITVRAKPVYAEWDIAHAAQFDTEFGPAVLLLLRPDAMRDFYRTTITNQGRRLVMTINGLPVGAHYIQRPVEDGRIAFFLEIDDEELPEVVRSIRKTSEEIEKQNNRSSLW